MERKWTEIKYHVQDNSAGELKDVKIYTVTEINFPAYHFLVHIPNLMAQGGLVRIIIYILIKNYAWDYVQFAVYHLLVLLVHQR